MKDKYARTHMKTAYQYASLSYCKRLQVGCVIVKDDRIISIGFNGTPPGWNNCCEDEHNKTRPEVIHAEANAIAKLAKTQGGGKGASVFITHAPCLDCAKQLATMEVKEVYYGEEYRDDVGVQHLVMCGVPTYHLSIYEKQQANNKEKNKCLLCHLRPNLKSLLVRLLRVIIKKL